MRINEVLASQISEIMSFWIRPAQKINEILGLSGQSSDIMKY
jgi:hypothetical protein